MTLHIEIDSETQKQLAIIANLEELSIEEVVTSYVKDRVRENEEYNTKLRAHLAVGEAQLDRGEFADYSLKKLKARIDKEYHNKKQTNGEI